MTPPNSPDLSPGMTSAAPLVCLKRLRHRHEFLAAARAVRYTTNGLTLQARERLDGLEHVGVGFTCSKKVGNAVSRNRAKRRLREVARLVLPSHGRPGWDYVLIGRVNATTTLPFADLIKDLQRALQKVHPS